MRKLCLAACLLLVFTVTGCKKKEMGGSSRSMPASTAAAEPAGGPEPQAVAPEISTQAVRPKIIMTAEAAVHSDDLARDLRAIKGKIQELGGYVAASTQDARDKLNRTARLSIKVPSEQFDPMMEYLETSFTVESVKTDSEDVSEEYVDVGSRVANLRVEEQGLVALMGNRSGKLADVLTVEHELSRVRGEIERLQGRLRYLDNRIGYPSST